MGSAAAARFPDATILVAEPDDVLRRRLVGALEGAGFAVAEACNARTALETLRARASGIDWLVTDVRLGDISGVHVAFEYRFIHPTRPILVISDFDIPAEIDRIEGARVIRKPFGMSFLLGELSAAIAGAEAADLERARGVLRAVS